MADWATKDQALIERVDGLLATAPVRRKDMFGSSAWFLELNDMMFAGAWGDSIMVRVGAERAATLIGDGDAEYFDPMGGRPMKEYVLLSSDRIAEDDVLLNRLHEASEFAEVLPPKKKKPRKRK